MFKPQLSKTLISDGSSKFHQYSHKTN